jgi:hypothetical protein
MLTVHGEYGRVEVQHAQPGEGEVKAGAVRVERARGELGGRYALVAELLVRLPRRRRRGRGWELRPRPHQDRRLLWGCSEAALRREQASGEQQRDVGSERWVARGE